MRDPSVREISCPGCGATLGISDAMMDSVTGGVIRCGGCHTIVHVDPRSGTDVPEPSEPRGDDSDRPRYRDDGRDERGRFDDEDRPRRPRHESRADDDYDRPKKKSGCGMWVIILGIVGVLGLGCCGGGGFLIYKFAGDPKWEPFASPDGRWSADFPGKPKMETKPIGGGASGNNTFYGAQRMFGREAFGVASADLDPVGVRIASHETLLNEGLNGILTGPQNAREISRRNLKMAGADAKELTVDVNDPQNGKGRMVVRIFIVENRLYTLVAVKMGPSGKDPPDAQRFFDSFRLTGKK